MSQGFTFDFDNVEEDDHSLVHETQGDIREDSAMQINPDVKEPKLHSIQEMVY